MSTILLICTIYDVFLKTMKAVYVWFQQIPTENII